MKTTIEIELQSFSIPTHVQTFATSDATRGPTTYPLSVLDAQTLDRLCSDFRQTVFKQAGKEMPPTCK